MAKEPSVIGALPPSESRASLQTDPFWQETPRYDRSSLAALMAAISQVVPPPPTRHTRTSTQARISQARRPQCTHITMVRLHGDHVCQHCGKTPSLGWLYACRADWLLDYQESTSQDAEDLTVPNESDYFDVMARLATSLKMSPSVVKQIRTGVYTFDEVDKIVAQREHVIATIKKAKNPETEETPPSIRSTLHSHEPDPDIIASMGASPKAVITKTTDITVSSTESQGAAVGQRRAPNFNDKCSYMCCHHCRPYMYDRVHVSLDTVLRGEQPPLTAEEAQQLFVLDADVLRKMDITPFDAPAPQASLTRSHRSVDITSQQRDGVDEDELDWTPISDDSSSIYDDDNDEFDSDAFPCPGAGLCPLYSPKDGCAYDLGFDDGQRAVNHSFSVASERDPDRDADYTTPDRARYRTRKLYGSVDTHSTPLGRSSTTSSISLPTPMTLPLTPITPVEKSFEDVLARSMSKPGKAHTVCGALSPSLGLGKSRFSVGTGLSGKMSKSTLGSELEVEGGVALTESAVESRLPDIATE